MVLLYFGVVFVSAPGLLSFVLLLLVLLTPMGLIIQMFSYPVIKKHMLDVQTEFKTGQLDGIEEADNGKDNED